MTPPFHDTPSNSPEPQLAYPLFVFVLSVFFGAADAAFTVPSRSKLGRVTVRTAPCHARNMAREARRGIEFTLRTLSAHSDLYSTSTPQEPDLVCHFAAPFSIQSVASEL